MVGMPYKKTRYPYVRLRGDVLYYVYRSHELDAKGKRRWVEVRYGVGAPKDAASAQRDAQERSDKIANGQLDPREAQIEEHQSRQIDGLIADYKRHVEHKGGSDQHVKTTTRYIERCVEWCGFKTIAHFDAARVQSWLDAEFKSRGSNLRPPTIAIRGLLNWAMETGKIKWNPLAKLPIPSDEEGKRPSRAMTRDQFDALIAAVPQKRAVFYQLAAMVGIRWAEIARLRWKQIDLESGAVLLTEGGTKAKRADALPLPDDVVAALKAYRPCGASLDDRLFRAEPRLRTWKNDLVKAGICLWEGDTLVGYVDEYGQLDRKCLRKSYATWLKHAGVDLRDAQKLMRHKDPKLTAKVYTEIRLADLKAAQARIGAKPNPQQKTG